MAMAETLDHYLKQFRALRTARSAEQWPAATNHRAPHKPLLLLSVLELVEEGMLTDNRIELTPDLVETFGRYWACVPSGYPRGRIIYPYFHLRSAGFWHLVAVPGKEVVLEAVRQINSAGQLTSLVQYARLDEGLFTLISVPECRQQLRDALIQTYFDREAQARLLLRAAVDREAFAYSQELLSGSGASLIREGTPEVGYRPAVRDQGFRRAVVVAYSRRCALCGIRILTLEGHTAVDAAHIIPWSVSQDDRPTNGMALCRLCHWAFDEGMLAVTHRYTVVTAPQLGLGENIPAHLGTLNGRGMIRPELEQHWPDLNALQWHRETIYRFR